MARKDIGCQEMERQINLLSARIDRQVQAYHELPERAHRSERVETCRRSLSAFEEVLESVSSRTHLELRDDIAALEIIGIGLTKTAAVIIR